MAEIVNISLDTLSADSKPLKSVNFGSGIEMLMNEKKRGTPTNDIKLDELEDLEKELQDNERSLDNTISFSSAQTKIFKTNDPVSSSNLEAPPEINLGESTKKEETSETWDGFKKFNDIPIAPDIPIQKESPMTKEQLLKEKFTILRKLEELEKKGVSLSKRYDMDSNLLEMQGEYETIMDEKKRSNSVKFQGQMLVTALTGLEWLNGKFDPFDFKLDGWAESVQESMGDYDEIFGELHEKYKSKGKLAPELRLLMSLAGSGLMIHMTNAMFKSAMPGMDDILKQNPDLMNQFTNAAVNSVSQQNPGFGGFMGGLMNNTASQPVPQTYQAPNDVNYSSDRPDLRKAKQSNFRDAESLENPYESTSDFRSSKKIINNNNRPEMKGPSDISDILSGLKTKKVNMDTLVKEEPKIQELDKGSTISITELAEMKTDMNNAPTKSKRRQKSDKNTVSLQI